MARPNSSLPKSCVLLVEGPDDKHVVQHILERYQIRLDFAVEDRGGVEPVLDSVGAELRVPGRQALGILVDANTDLSARWDAVKARLLTEEIGLPQRPVAGGTISPTGSKPRVGVWLMPDNTSTGELEDFVVQMMPAGDPVWPMSQGYIDAISDQDRKFSRQKTQRAKLHAGWQPEKIPGAWALPFVPATWRLTASFVAHSSHGYKLSSRSIIPMPTESPYRPGNCHTGPAGGSPVRRNCGRDNSGDRSWKTMSTRLPMATLASASGWNSASTRLAMRRRPS